jgi:hypothetical protein
MSAGYNEFTVRAGGNNLNAGTLDFAAEAATAALATVTNGAWDGATIYTAASGSDLSQFTVGRCVSWHPDGASAPTANSYGIGRISAVNAGTRQVTVAAITNLGTLLTVQASGVTMRLGGAWAGGSGAVAFPVNFVTGNTTNAAGLVATRVNNKNDQTYSPTAVWATPTLAANRMVRYEGYTATFGDGGLWTMRGPTTGTSFILLDIVNFVQVAGLDVAQNGNSGGADLIRSQFGSTLLRRIVAHDCRGTAINSSGAGIVEECEVYGWNQSATAVNGINTSGRIIRCKVHHPSGTHAAGSAIGGTFTYIEDCIVSDTTGTQPGIAFGNGGGMARGCVVHNVLGTGFTRGSPTAVPVYLENCVATKCGNNAVNGPFFLKNCAFGRGNYGNTSGDFGPEVIADINTVTLPADTSPYINEAVGDFRPAIPQVRGTGYGSFFETYTGSGWTGGTVGYPDIGAAQQQPATLPVIGDVRSGTSFGFPASPLVGTHTDPATSNVVAGVQWGAGGTEFTGTYSATTNPPTAPSLVVTDNGDGTGATATVAGADGGTTEKVYYADPAATGLVTYAFIAQRVSSGTLPLPVPAGRWIFRVLSYAASGVYSVGASYETTISGLPAAGVVDNGDGTGLQVTTTDPDATAIHTVEIQDATIGTWRDGPNRTGPGTISVAAGEGIDNVVPGRTYWVRVRNLDSGNTTWTAQTLITPTVGYASDIYTLILAAKQKLIAHPIPRIGGRVYECLDPFTSLAAKPDLPAAFIWQPGSETVNPSASDGGGGPTFKARTGLNVPIEIVIADVFDSNDSTNLQWWLAARQWVFDLFNRQPTSDSDNPKTPHGRRWQVVPGPITPADPSKYEYRTCTMILNTNIERTIGG